MRRLVFVASTLALSAFVGPATLAQDASRIPAIGVLTPASGPNAPMMHVLRQELQQLGFVDGKTVRIEFGFADGDMSRIPALASHLVEKRVDVIVTDGGNVGTKAVQSLTSDIPIVMATAAEPVENGIAISYAKPGGNATGFVLHPTELTPKRLEVARSLYPGMRQVAVIWNPRTGNRHLAALQAAAPTFGLELLSFAAGEPAEFASAVAAAAASPADLLFVTPDAVFFNARAELVWLVNASRKPAMYASREYVEAGGLMGYGPLGAENFKRVAAYVGRILKGEKPGDLPIENPTRFVFTINAKTAQMLGIDISDALLARADEVIE
jgi:putative tryptophan/tyrosine transport system substrate-binding protein